MKTYLDCIPCFVRHSLDAARIATDDEPVHERVLREAARLAGDVDFTESPPATAQKMHRLGQPRLVSMPTIAPCSS